MFKRLVILAVFVLLCLGSFGAPVHARSQEDEWSVVYVQCYHGDTLWSVDPGSIFAVTCHYAPNSTWVEQDRIIYVPSF